MTMILIYIITQFVSVVSSTLKTLFTVKGGRLSAASMAGLNSGIACAITYLTAVADFSFVWKMLIAIVVTMAGTWIVKWLEEKSQKEKLWVYYCTINSSFEYTQKIENLLKEGDIKLLYDEIEPEKLYSMQVFSQSKKDSSLITSILQKYDVKYYVIESAK